MVTSKPASELTADEAWAMGSRSFAAALIREQLDVVVRTLGRDIAEKVIREMLEGRLPVKGGLMRTLWMARSYREACEHRERLGSLDDGLIVSSVEALQGLHGPDVKLMVCDAHRIETSVLVQVRNLIRSGVAAFDVRGATIMERTG